MSYEPKEWVSGEVITADGLNNIEEGVQEALECWESGGDCGYSCETTSTVLTEETVTTSGSAPYISADLSYSTPIDASSLTATFEGVDYELDKVDLGWGIAYGDWQNTPDFTNYPLAILSSHGANTIFTENAGTYSIKIIANIVTVTASDCFEKAVKLFGLKYVADANVQGGVLANDVSVNTVTAQYALAEGNGTTASGMASHAEGYNHTTASGTGSHAEGGGTTASGTGSHAEGGSTTASGSYSHAEGVSTRATADGGFSCHAEGYTTEASGDASHAEGHTCVASGQSSHAEGYTCVASGRSSHAQNYSTTAQGYAQTAIGAYNVAQGSPNSNQASDYAFIIGNGNSPSSRSNALAIKWDGTFVFANGTEITPAQFASLLALLQ